MRGSGVGRDFVTPPHLGQSQPTVNSRSKMNRHVDIPLDHVNREDCIGEGSRHSHLGKRDVYLEFEVKPRTDLRGVNNVAATPRQGLYIFSPLDWGTGGFNIQVLIDCGATVSLLHEDIFAQIPANVRPPLYNNEVKVTFADGSTQSCAGQVDFPLKIGDSWHTITFLVGNYTDEAILGMRDLQNLGLSIDFEGMIVAKGGQWIPTQDVAGNWVSRQVKVRKSVVVPARTQVILEASVIADHKSDSKNSPAYLMEPEPSVAEELGVLPAWGLHAACSDTVPVVIHNPLDSSVTLEPDTVLGHLVSPFCQPDSGTLSSSSPHKVRMTNVTVEQTSNVPVSVDRQPDGDLPLHLTDLFERSSAHLNDTQQGELHQVLLEYQDVFSKDNYDLGRTHLIEHTIDTGDSNPIRQAPRRQNPEAAAAADQIVEELLVHKLIEPSQSPWASPIVMVKRKDGRYRMCIDFREVNKRTLNSSAFPLPRIDDTLDSLSKAKWFCTTDLTAGYHQVPMSESSKAKTAFCTRRGLYEWNVLPFGVCAGPGTFMQLMENVLADMRYTSCLVFLDDVVTFGDTFSQTLENYRQFCERMRTAGLKLKPSKCSLFQKSVSFLGHVVSEEGIGTDPEKIAAVQSWPVPKKRKEVRSFLGLVGYYRKFIPDCSTVAKPLTELTSPSVTFEWTEGCQEAFEALKQSLLQAPILGYPKEDAGQFILDTDASDVGLGAVLSQVQGDKEVVLAYASRTFSPAEANYCVTRRELLAIVHSVKLFKSYLLLRPFKIRTDHSSLKFLNRFKEPEGQLARWIDFLQPYQFEIEHRPGVKHGNADALSRRPDPCGGKKCYCLAFEDLQYEPPVVLESQGQVDVAVQATPEVTSCDILLHCCASQEVKTSPTLVLSESKAVQYPESPTVSDCAQLRVVKQTDGATGPCKMLPSKPPPTCQRDVNGITLFFGRNTVLSNFYPCTFVDENGESYNCTEQFYHAEKAKTFWDQEAYREIKDMSNPRDMKARAKSIKGFNIDRWREVDRGIMYRGCLMKFEQNPELAEFLINQTEPLIAEASPYDSYWGIGLGIFHPSAGQPEQWRGSNVLGEVLMEVRSRLTTSSGDCRFVSVDPLWTSDEVQQAQQSDPDLGPVWQLVQKGEKPKWSSISHLGERSKVLLQVWDQLVIKDGQLKRKFFSPKTQNYWFQLVLPKEFWEQALKFAHDIPTAGHTGEEKTYQRLKAKFWWPGMKKYTSRWVSTCSACQKRKAPHQKAKAPMQSYVVGALGERVASDIMGPFSETDSGNRYIVVFIDYFSKYADAAPMADMTAQSVADAFLERWISYFGIPKELHTDQGTQYEGELMLNLCKLLGIAKTRTTPLRPQGDGLAEKLNKTLCDMLNCVRLEHPFSWDTLLPMVTLAYNSSQQESIQETPHMMVFGKEATLPISLLAPPLESEQDEAKSAPDYVLQKQKHMEQVHHMAREHLHGAAMKQQASYNNRLLVKEYKVGDLVYYWYPVKGAHTPKEAFYKWLGPYVVIKQLSETVYRIQKTPRSKSFVVNHDKLKPAKLREPIDTSWALKRQCPPEQEVVPSKEIPQDSTPRSQAGRNTRPRRSAGKPDRLGDWQY